MARLMAVAMLVAWAGSAHAQFGKLKGLINKAKESISTPPVVTNPTAAPIATEAGANAPKAPLAV